MKQLNKRKIAGWLAVGLSTVITCTWAFWGIVENFHEGWYFETLWSNLGLMLVQYLSPMIIFMGITLISIYWPRYGSATHAFIALLAIGFFRASSNAASYLIILPLLGLGILYWFGRPEPRKVAAILIIGLPMLTVVLAGIAPAIRVSQRLDDRNPQAVKILGNGVHLTWAPQGPGWPLEGGDWYAAQQACLYLSQDGLVLSAAPRKIWRLPSVDEAVRTMSRHGQNSGGYWSTANAEAIYITTPDKESPLWNVFSQVVYWWTATEVDEEHAYIIVYDGKVWSREKNFGPEYLGFRCVR